VASSSNEYGETKLVELHVHIKASVMHSSVLHNWLLLLPVDVISPFSSLFFYDVYNEHVFFYFPVLMHWKETEL
jgi:hypothetical protein